MNLTEKQHAAFDETSTKFAGCDGGDPGSPQRPSIWLMGIEHGTYKSSLGASDPSYSIETQLGYMYNRQAFKLLAAIDGAAVASFKEFAERKRPFEKGSFGYFKGNLYAHACHAVSAWDEAAQQKFGCTKEEYKRISNKKRLPAISGWVEEYRPKLFIGVGLGYLAEFAIAFAGRPVGLEEVEIGESAARKRVRFYEDDTGLLVVIPHLTGGRYGLNSTVSIEAAANIIRARL